MDEPFNQEHIDVAPYTSVAKAPEPIVLSSTEDTPNSQNDLEIN